MEEIMDKRKKDRLVKGIFLNGFIVIGCIVYIIIYILPQYDAMGKTLAKISDTRADISSLKSNGPSASSFTELLTRLGKKKELSDIVFSDATKLNNVLKKPATIKTDYLSWITSENIKIGDIDKEIQENDAILGNIIPVFMNSSNTIPDPDIENQITLSSFISYIEKEILQKYTLSSYAPLGISNITFPDKKDTPINIGNFKITLDFKGRNSNILAFIDAIQSSWKLTIQNGKFIAPESKRTRISDWKWLSNLSNMLVTIENFSLNAIPNVSSQENSGNITIEFYVEGMNYERVLLLRSLLITKFNLLQKDIKAKGSLCAKSGNILCENTTTANAIYSIKNLIKNLSGLQPKFDAFKKWDITLDINKEIENLSDLKSTLESIELTYLKNNSILEKAKK